MKAVEALLQRKRVTCSQTQILVGICEAEDERAHAAMLALARLTDAVEAEAPYMQLFARLRLHPEIEKRARLIVSALAAEALCEEVYLVSSSAIFT
jgi:hypothetical protein